MGLVKTKFLLLSLILVLAMFAAIRPIRAGDDVTISSLGPVVVVAGQSSFTLIQFNNIPSGEEVTSVTISCTGLPAGATCSTNPPNLLGPWFNGNSFEVVVNTSSSTPSGTYTIIVDAFFTETSTTVTIIQPSFLVLSGGSLGPESISIQQDPPPSATTTFRLTVNPASTIPEYPLGLPILAILTIISYGLIRRKIKNAKN